MRDLIENPELVESILPFYLETVSKTVILPGKSIKVVGACFEYMFHEKKLSYETLNIPSLLFHDMKELKIEIIPERGVA